MRLALVKNCVVVNVVESIAGIHSEFVEIESHTAGIGDLWDGEQFTMPYVEPAPQILEAAPKVVEVSIVQAIEALKRFGLLEAVEGAIESLQKNDLARVAWERSPVVRRDSPTAGALSAMLGIGSEKMDELFLYAASVKF
jgi:hypothetical protein